MDLNKFAMLKATLASRDSVSIARIKADFKISNEEAEEMLNKLIQAGLVEPFSFDGINFKVKH